MFNQLDPSTRESHEIDIFNVLKSVVIWANADLSNDQLWIYIPYVLKIDHENSDTSEPKSVCPTPVVQMKAIIKTGLKKKKRK